MMGGLARAAMLMALLGVSACASLVTGGPLIREGEPTGVIRVENGSSQIITVILISDCSASTYGLNRLPEGVTVPRGRYYDFTVSAGCWDVKAGWGISQSEYAAATERMHIPAGGGTRYTVTD